MSPAFDQADPRDEIVEFLPEMRAFALSLTRNPSQADDLVQDAIIKAWKSFHQFEASTNLRAWLFTIVRNTFYSDLRRKRREVAHIETTLTEMISDGQTPDTRIELMDFEKALMLLPDEQREALILVGASGMSYEEAAETCNVAIGTIKSRINRGRKRLAELLEYKNETDQNDD
ncbi:sigma-70 family RNA polymerase sigma factor [Yoonia sp. R2-816]|uniref:sigma-70 family RNA polymerase sigma factor n=1 Tax=Yoonia sp. R2-816 TaxID=3342638 RepID=UPI00372B57DA